MFSHRSVVRRLLQEVRKEIARARARAPAPAPAPAPQRDRFRWKERLRIDGTSIFIIAALSYEIISEWRYNSYREERRKSREIALNPKKEHSSSGD